MTGEKPWNVVNVMDLIREESEELLRDNLNTGEIQPDWVACQVIGGVVQVGEAIKGAYGSDPNYVGAVKLCVQSESELEELAKASGLEVKYAGERDMDGIIETRYRFVPFKHKRKQ